MTLKNIFDLAKSGLDRLSDIRRWYVWRRIEKIRAGKNYHLSAQQKKDVFRFYKCINKKIDIFAHAFYTDKTGLFDVKWIPDSLWYAYIEPYYNHRSLAKALDTKILYDRVLGGVKHPHTLAYKINGYWIDETYRPISVTDVTEKAKAYTDIFVKKAEDSAGGHGVVHFSMPKEADGLRSALMNSDFNLVVQVGLHQHKEMAKLNPSSVNTIRILSHLTKDGEVKIRSIVVRFGRNGAHVDNASSGGVTVGVCENGRLKDIGFDVKGNSYDVHPDTKIKFSSVVIPNFSKILDVAINLQWEFPQFRLLSWDIAVDELGEPVLIEVNMHSGQIDFHQLNNGPLFGDDTEIVLKEVFN